MKNKIFVLLSFVTILALLGACNNKTGSDFNVTPTPVASLVTAEGHIIPNQSLYLSFVASGRVSEILVSKGEHVKAGDILARIGDRQQAEANLNTALFTQTGAQQDYDKLIRTAGLVHAQAWLDYLNAQKNRGTAKLAWDHLDQSSIESDILDAQAEVTSRQTDLENAQKDFDKYSNLPTTNTTRKSYEEALRTAQTNFDLAVQKLDTLTAKRDLVKATLELAQGTEDETKLTYENTRDGPDVDILVLTQAHLDTAIAQVAAAQYALDNYDLKAPFDGIVEDINISLFQVVGPSTWAIALADKSVWYVDTSDLGEIDVVKIKPGQTATVTVDALPGETFTGVVESISGAPTVQGGDILYKVHIRLNDTDPRFLWGMTVEVTFNDTK
jgi:multidrug resistance efflux pump